MSLVVVADRSSRRPRPDRTDPTAADEEEEGARTRLALPADGMQDQRRLSAHARYSTRMPATHPTGPVPTAFALN